MSDTHEFHDDALDPDLSESFEAFFAEEEEERSEGHAASPEPVSAASAAAETPEAATPDRGDGRDAKGRFAAKAEPPADSRDAQAADAAGVTAPEGAAPGSAQPTPDPRPAPDAIASAAVEPPVPPTPDAPAFEPFAVKFGQQTVTIPGAVITPDGAVIPPAALEQVHTLMGRGLKYDAERNQFKALKAELDQARRLHEAQVKPVLDEMGQFFELARTLHGAKDEASQMAAAEQLINYALAFAQQEPLLLDRMRLEKERAQLELQRQQAQPDPEEQAQQLEQQVRTTLDELVGEYQQHPALRVLTDADWQALQQRVLQEPERYVYRVGPQPTPEEQAVGAMPGEYVWNAPRWEADVKERQAMRQEMAALQAQHQRALAAATQAAQENAKRAAAPVVAAKPSPARATPKPVAPKAPDPDDDFEDRLNREFSALLNT